VQPVQYIRFLGGCFLISILTCSACRVNREDDPVIHYTADPEYQIDLYEQRDPVNGDPLLGLWVESIQSFDFDNYQIIDTVRINGRQIEVELSGVKKPDIGSGLPGTAKGFIPIGNLPDGEYPFNISLAGAVVNKGALKISAGHSTLSMPGPQGIIIQNLVMEHIPDGLIWGYAATPSEPQQPLANAFILELKTVSADPGLAPGYYSYFTITGTGDVFLHSSIKPDGLATNFVRRLTGQPVDLHNILQTYRAKPLPIRCLTTFGAQ
jgi:hypothetical protein